MKFSQSIMGKDDVMTSGQLDTVVDHLVLPNLELIRETELKLFLQLQLCFNKSTSQNGFMSGHIRHYNAGIQVLCHDLLKLHSIEKTLKNSMSMGEILDQLEPTLLGLLKRATTFRKHINSLVREGANNAGDLLVQDYCQRLMKLLQTHYEIVLNYLHY